MRTRQTFKEILLEVEDANSACVMRRARLANQLAKVSVAAAVVGDRSSYAKRRARRRCYALKARALEHGIAAFPDHYVLASVEEDGRLVGISWSYRASFHLPTDALGARTHAWLEQQRAHVVSQRLAA